MMLRYLAQGECVKILPVQITRGQFNEEHSVDTFEIQKCRVKDE